MSVAATLSAEGSIPFRWSRSFADQVRTWSSLCDLVLEWSGKMLRCQTEGAEKERFEFRRALKYLLGLGRVIRSTITEPGSAERSLLSEVEGRVLQLESCWRLHCEPPVDPNEAAAVLKEAFPGEADQKLIAELFPKPK